jgi:AAA family ATP:ADP antiporter
MTAVLTRFFNVRREEVGAIVAATLYFFCVLTALQILRPTRDALGMQRGIDEIRWLFLLTLVATLAVNPMFGWLVSRYRRLAFIGATHAFFVINLLVFFGLLAFTPQVIGERTGQVFYVWVSVFNYFVTMVFWALMADRFTVEQSKRLFGLIAVGGTAGAIAGSSLASLLAQALGVPLLLVIAAAFLGLATLAAWFVSRESIDEQVTMREPTRGGNDDALIGGSAWEGFRAVLKSPYLLGIAAYVLILAVMVTFIYFTRLKMVAELGGDVDMRAGVFAQLDLATQVATFLLQLVVAGRLMKRFGVHVTLALLPVTVALGFIGLAIVGSLVALVAFDATFRAIQRAIMRPARETLFTVVVREDKYKAKALIDTFGYRAGDAVGAMSEGLLGKLGMGLAALAITAVPLALVWAALGIWLGRTQQRIANAPRSQVPTGSPLPGLDPDGVPVRQPTS